MQVTARLLDVVARLRRRAGRPATTVARLHEQALAARAGWTSGPDLSRVAVGGQTSATVA